MTRGWPFLAKQIISDTQGELAIYQLKKNNDKNVILKKLIKNSIWNYKSVDFIKVMYSNTSLIGGVDGWSTQFFPIN